MGLIIEWGKSLSQPSKQDKVRGGKEDTRAIMINYGIKTGSGRKEEHQGTVGQKQVVVSVNWRSSGAK